MARTTGASSGLAADFTNSPRRDSSPSSWRDVSPTRGRVHALAPCASVAGLVSSANQLVKQLGGCPCPLRTPGCCPKGAGYHHYPRPIVDIDHFRRDDFNLFVTDKKGLPAAVVPVSADPADDQTLLPAADYLAQQAFGATHQRCTALPPNLTHIGGNGGSARSTQRWKRSLSYRGSAAYIASATDTSARYCVVRQYISPQAAADLRGLGVAAVSRPDWTASAFRCSPSWRPAL